MVCQSWTLSSVSGMMLRVVKRRQVWTQTSPSPSPCPSYQYSPSRAVCELRFQFCRTVLASIPVPLTHPPCLRSFEKVHVVECFKFRTNMAAESTGPKQGEGASSASPPAVLMIGTGEYTTGFGKESSKTDKGAGGESSSAPTTTPGAPFAPSRNQWLPSLCLTCGSGDWWEISPCVA